MGQQHIEVSEKEKRKEKKRIFLNDHELHSGKSESHNFELITTAALLYIIPCCQVTFLFLK